MCDYIQMPNGEFVETIRADGNCLCWSDQKEVIAWIGANIPNLEFDEMLTISRDCCGYQVSIDKIVEVKT